MKNRDPLVHIHLALILLTRGYTNFRIIDICELVPRLDDRDLADIEECIKRFKLQRRAICQRAERVQYVGNDSIFLYNLKTVLDRFFKKRPNKPARGAIS